LKSSVIKGTRQSSISTKESLVASHGHLSWLFISWDCKYTFCNNQHNKCLFWSKIFKKWKKFIIAQLRVYLIDLITFFLLLLKRPKGSLNFQIIERLFNFLYLIDTIGQVEYVKFSISYWHLIFKIANFLISAWVFYHSAVFCGFMFLFSWGRC
jgi:hypothetical protein